MTFFKTFLFWMAAQCCFQNQRAQVLYNCEKFRDQCSQTDLDQLELQELNKEVRKLERQFTSLQDQQKSISFNLTKFAGVLWPGNLALNKRTNQSSTFGGLDEWSSDRAVDGVYGVNTDSNNNCSRTTNETQPYLYIDLNQTVLVSKVIIHMLVLPGYGLRDLQIFVGTDSNMEYFAFLKDSESAAKKVMLCAKPLLGRWVKIGMKTAGTLTLCEVEVYAIERCV